MVPLLSMKNDKHTHKTLSNKNTEPDKKIRYVSHVS